MSEKKVNQVIVNGEELINLRNDTVTPQTLVKDETATNKEGAKIVGELDPVSHDEAYVINDPEGDIDDSDYIPFNDVSDEEHPKKKTLFSSIVAKLRNIFTTKTGDNITDKDGFRQNIHTLEWLGTNIPDNADLDTYTTAGNYRVVSDASGGTIANLPLALCGKVIVFNNGNGGIEQFYFANHSPRIFVRTKFGSGAWTAWKELGEGGDSKDHTYELGTLIPNGSDANNYTTEGIYYYSGLNSTTQMTNFPHCYYGGTLIVSKWRWGNDEYVQQTFMPYNYKAPVRMYKRSNMGGWQKWVEYANLGEDTYTLNNDPYNNSITHLTTGTDLDTIVAHGTYSGGSTGNYVNCPVNGYQFKMVVDQGLISQRQIITVVDNGINTDGGIWTRQAYARSTVHSDTTYYWTPWVNILEGSTKPHTYEMGTEIPANSDLNTYTTIGVYQCLLSATARTMSNLPYTGNDKHAFKLIVSTVRGTANIIQMWIPFATYTNCKICYRTTDDNGTTWQVWNEIVTKNDLIPHTYEVGTDIPSNSDLNTYTTEGVYRIAPNSVAETIANMPIINSGKNAGKLIVMIGVASASSYVQQIFTDHYYANVYIRSTRDGGTTWEDWKLLGSQVLDAKGCVDIPANSDLNSYTSFGVYRYSAGNASTIINRPLSANEAIVLWVMRSWDDNYVRQIAFMRNTQRIATRTYHDGTTWEEWKGLAYQDDISPSTVGNGYAVATVSGSAITATISGFKLRAGVMVAIRMGRSIPANATLNINNTGAKNIQYVGQYGLSNVGAQDFRHDGVYTFIYTGSVYMMVARTNSAIILTHDYVADTSGDIAIESSYNANVFQLKYNIAQNKLYWTGYKNSAWRGDKALAEQDDLGASVAKVGKNILPSWGYTTNVRTHNGITFTFNPSTGEITANGTATADANCVLAGNNTTYGYYIPKGSYVLSGCPSGGANNKYFISLQYHDSEFHSQFDYGNGTTFTLNNDVYCKISDDENYYIRIRSGQTVSNIVFKPMLRPAFTTADYEPCEDISKGNCYVGRCETAGGTKDKVAYVDGYFVLRKGVRIAIKFSNTNTANSTTDNPITLNVNNTGAKYIWRWQNHTGAANAGTDTISFGVAGRYNFYIYDGTYWVWAGASGDNNSTNFLRNDASSIAKVNDASPYITLKSSVVDITQSNNGVSSTSYPAFIIEDKNGKCLSRLESIVETGGNVATFLQVRNYKSDGTNPNGGIKVFMNKNGDIWYAISSPQNFNASTGIGYGTCTTSAGTKDKVVTLSNFVLTVGGIIGVRFSNTNTYSATADNKVTLNVNNTGAKPIYYGTGYPTGIATTAFGEANKIHYYMYDGTNWVWHGKSSDNDTTDPRVLGFGYGTCSTAEATTAKVVTLGSYTLRNGGYVSVKFTYAVPANSTMNINNRGAKEIWYRGAKITANVINAGDLATFIYDGTRYHLVGIDGFNVSQATTLTNSTYFYQNAIIKRNNNIVSVMVNGFKNLTNKAFTKIDNMIPIGYRPSNATTFTITDASGEIFRFIFYTDGSLQIYCYNGIVGINNIVHTFTYII